MTLLGLMPRRSQSCAGPKLSRDTLRNSLFLRSRVGISTVLATVVGALWLNTPLRSTYTKWGYLLFVNMLAGMGNQSEMPFTVSNKFIAYKHMENGLFAPYMYVLAATGVNVPLALAETLVSTAISYHMTGLANEGGRWIFFAFIVFLVPALSLLFNDLLLLVPSVVMFLVFRVVIRSEEEFLAERFGAAA